jgi:hypothetical protein
VVVEAAVAAAGAGPEVAAAHGPAEEVPGRAVAAERGPAGESPGRVAVAAHDHPPALGLGPGAESRAAGGRPRSARPAAIVLPNCQLIVPDRP